MKLLKVRSQITARKLNHSFTMLSITQGSYPIVKESFSTTEGMQYFISDNEYVATVDQTYEGEKFTVEEEAVVVQYWNVSYNEETFRFEYDYNIQDLLKHFSKVEIENLKFELKAEVK